MPRGYRPCVRRPLSSPPSSPASCRGPGVGGSRLRTSRADGAVRGAGVRGDGVAQVIFGAGAQRAVGAAPLRSRLAGAGRLGAAPRPHDGGPERLRRQHRLDAHPGGELVVSSRGTASRRDDGSWSAPLDAGHRGAGSGRGPQRLPRGRGGMGRERRRGLRGAARPLRGVGRAEAGSSPPGATTGSPVRSSLGESGDALVAWVRGAAGAGSDPGGDPPGIAREGRPALRSRVHRSGQRAPAAPRRRGAAAHGRRHRRLDRRRSGCQRAPEGLGPPLGSLGLDAARSRSLRAHARRASASRRPAARWSRGRGTAGSRCPSAERPAGGGPACRGRRRRPPASSTSSSPAWATWPWRPRTPAAATCSSSAVRPAAGRGRAAPLALAPGMVVVGAPARERRR